MNIKPLVGSSFPFLEFPQLALYFSGIPIGFALYGGFIRIISGFASMINSFKSKQLPNLILLFPSP